MKTVSKNIYGFENRKQKNLRFWNRKKSEIWFTVLKTVRDPYGSNPYPGGFGGMNKTPPGFIPRDFIYNIYEQLRFPKGIELIRDPLITSNASEAK